MPTGRQTDFPDRVDAALARVRSVLGTTKNPQAPADVPHRYDDKFHLVEFIGRAATASLLRCLVSVGLTPDGLARLRAASASQTVTLRLRAREDTTYLREERRKLVPTSEIVTEVSTPSEAHSISTKVVDTVIDHHWRFDVLYEIVAFEGTKEAGAVALLSRGGTVELKTAARTTPYPATVVRRPLDADVSWLLRQLDGDGNAAFGIDRTHAGCHTPRRNEEVAAAAAALRAIDAWCGAVETYFRSTVFAVHSNHGLDVTAIDDEGVFVPVVAFLEASAGAERVPFGDLKAFLEEERRSLAAKHGAIDEAFPHGGGVVTAVEARLLVTVLHARSVCRAFLAAVDHVEQLLRDQLISAIGREIGPADFAAYMDFHHKKLMRPEFRPLPFSHAVRRPGHDPEGTLSVEALRGDEASEPILTTVAVREAQRPMSFALDASTRVSFLGDRLLHGWVSHQFSGASGLALELVARARQFSSFILLVGRVASADEFEPKFGVVVQNKDVLRIPLMLELIPTPKEFRDAIESLSPEQQRFAKAFRAMQLESTLFGVCVVQIKPALEKLLCLNPDSLTKHIRLTQDLLQLFGEHQIPSDLLSYEGPEEATAADKIAWVEHHVTRMREMIDQTRQRELEEAQEAERFRRAEADRSMMDEDPDTARAFGGPPRTMTMGAPPPPPGRAPPAMGGTFLPPPALAGAPRPAAGGRARQAPPPPPPQPAAQEPTARPRPRQPSEATTGAADTSDYTRIPAELDRRFEEFDDDGALRPAIVHCGPTWTRTARKSLLAKAETSALDGKAQETERSRAFDLLSALTKSGALTIDQATLHVVVVATHGFDRTLVETVIQGNVNPIEKVERSLMIVATTLHGVPASDMLSGAQRERFLTWSPRLGPAVTSEEG